MDKFLGNLLKHRFFYRTYLKLTAKTPENGWFPFGARPIFRGELLVSGSVVETNRTQGMSRFLCEGRVFLDQESFTYIILKDLCWVLDFQGKYFDMCCSSMIWWSYTTYALWLLGDSSHSEILPSICCSVKCRSLLMCGLFWMCGIQKSF